MTEYALILVSTVLVNNFVLVKFLGLCPFMGVSRKLETAMGMGLATTFVLTLSSVSSYLVNAYIREPLGVEYLRTIAFILVIAASVQFTEIMVRRLSPLLDQVLEIGELRVVTRNSPTSYTVSPDGPDPITATRFPVGSSLGGSSPVPLS